MPRCLDSLSKQSINADVDVEFVLVNDGSPDKCLKLIQNFAAKDTRTVVLNQKNQGVSAARNAGLKIARGEYVFFLDGDDFLTDDASQILYDVCKEHNCDIIVTNAYRVKDGQWNVKLDWNTCPKLSPGYYSVNKFVEGTTVLPISFKAYRRDLIIEKSIQYDENLKVGEVFTFFLNVLQNSKTIYYTDMRIMNYVLRNSGAMRNVNVKTDMSILKTMAKMDEYASGPLIDLRGSIPYNVAFDRVVRMFTLNKYTKQSDYTKEIGSLLSVVKKNKLYRDVLYFIAFRNCPLNIKIYALGQLLLPSKFFYIFLRWLMRLLHNNN